MGPAQAAGLGGVMDGANAKVTSTAKAAVYGVAEGQFHGRTSVPFLIGYAGPGGPARRPA